MRSLLFAPIDKWMCDMIVVKWMLNKLIKSNFSCFYWYFCFVIHTGHIEERNLCEQSIWLITTNIYT
jgi:hypothetical protein